MILHPAKQIKGSVCVPSDKSISHRSIMFGSLAQGTTTITNCLLSADCLSTISCFRSMGIDITISEDQKTVTVQGKGLHGLKEPSCTLDTGNSGTTTRLISGILAGQTFATKLSGDASLNTRPMKRIMKPLSQMGASIVSENGNDCAPLVISPSTLHGITYDSPIASAQVKSCVLLAGLYANSPTTVTEPYVSRDHTERMLRAFGAQISQDGISSTIQPNPKLHGLHIEVPGDISAAAYFIAAALLVQGSELLIENVGINPTRGGILKVCEAMGADIELQNERLVSGEPVADLLVKTSSLKGTIIEGEMIPTLIDEVPIIAVMASQAEGTTIIRDAADLKAKESDRIATVVTNLKAMGADITATDDGMIINGPCRLTGAQVDSYMDHRIAMMSAIASLIADGQTDLKDSACVDISYPDFYEDLSRVSVLD